MKRIKFRKYRVIINKVVILVWQWKKSQRFHFKVIYDKTLISFTVSLQNSLNFKCYRYFLFLSVWYLVRKNNYLFYLKLIQPNFYSLILMININKYTFCTTTTIIAAFGGFLLQANGSMSLRTPFVRCNKHKKSLLKQVFNDLLFC